MEFDLNVLLLNHQDGRDLPALPGIRTAIPSRRVARGRGNDRLIIMLVAQENLTGEQINRLLDGIENTFYNTAGTATSAMRTVMEEVNQALLNHNLRHGSSGKQVAAALCLMVFRGEMLYLAQTGQMYGFLVKPDDVANLYDPQSASRGLGSGRIIDVHYSQASLTNGMLLLLTPQVPSGWSKNMLAGAYGEQMGSLRRRLLSQTGIDLQALVIGVQSGTGSINLVSPNVLSSAAPRLKLQTPRAPDSQLPAAGQTLDQDQSWETLDTAPEEGATLPLSAARKPVKAGHSRQNRRLRTPQPQQSTRQPHRPHTVLTQKTASAARQAAVKLGRAWVSIRTFLLRVLPLEDDFKLPTSAMMITAITVPLVVVAASVLIYLRVGLPKQYNMYYQQAQSFAAEAQTLTKARQQYTAYQEAIKYLDLAEQYKQTDESQALRQKVQLALDSFDRVSRLDFSNAIAGSISATVEIVNMIATGRDIYMLDQTSGSVLHARFIGSTYEMDSDFRCGPDQYGTLIVESIVDIAPLSRSSQGDNTIIALDENGILLYCEPGKGAVAVPLIPPDSNWGQPTAISLEENNLLVLDPLTNAIWLYLGDNGDFPESPYFFFSDKVPSLAEAIDIAIGQQQLFILNSDGHTTTCDYNNLIEAKTTCTDPATLQDDRPGHESGPMIEGARFYQLSRTQPPEPSIYYLDPIEKVLYQFSMKLNLVQTYRSQEELPQGLATAFAVSPTRSVFLAIKNQVFVAFLP